MVTLHARQGSLSHHIHRETESVYTQTSTTTHRHPCTESVCTPKHPQPHTDTRAHGLTHRQTQQRRWGLHPGDSFVARVDEPVKRLAVDVLGKRIARSSACRRRLGSMPRCTDALCPRPHRHASAVRRRRWRAATCAQWTGQGLVIL